MSDLADGIPVVGHAKGGIHYICGDEEGGDKAMISATRTTVVAGSGVVGTLVAGPVGAVALGINGGLLYDTGHSIATDKPQGFAATVDKIAENPGDAGAWVDAAGGLAMDGVTGYGAGRAARQIKSTRAAAQTAQIPAEPAAQSVRVSAQRPAVGPGARAAAQPAARPAARPAAQPAAQSVRVSAQRPAVGPGARAVAQPVAQTVTRPGVRTEAVNSNPVSRSTQTRRHVEAISPGKSCRSCTPSNKFTCTDKFTCIECNPRGELLTARVADNTVKLC